MLSTSGALDRHISMLSSSCDSEVEFDMHITIEAGLACTLLQVHRWDLGVAEGGPSEGVHVRSEEHAEKFMLPKRRFWKVEQKMKCRFSKHFSRS